MSNFQPVAAEFNQDGTLVKIWGPNSQVAFDPSSVGMNAPRRVAIIGNSIDAYATVTSGGTSATVGTLAASPYANSISGWLSWLQWIGGQRLSVNPVLNKATAGESSSQMLARYGADIAANYSSFDLLFMMNTATNDLVQSIPKETTLANIQTMATSALSTGKWVVMGVTLPRGAWSPLAGAQITAARQQQYWVNEKLRQWALSSGYARLILVDCTGDFIDPTSATGDPNSAFVRADLLHPNSTGMFNISQRILSAIASVVPPMNNRGQGQADNYDATNNPLGNLVTNPGLNGTAGTVTNTTGIAADGCILSRNSGTFLAADCVGSKEAISAAYNPTSTTQRQVVTFSTTSGKTAAESVRFRLPDITTGFTTADRVYFMCEVDVSSMARVYSIELQMQASNSDTVRDGMTIFPDLLGMTSTGTLMMRTPLYTVPAGTTFLRPSVFVTGDATTGGMSFTAKVGAPAVRRVE